MAPKKKPGLSSPAKKKRRTSTKAKAATVTNTPAEGTSHEGEGETPAETPACSARTERSASPPGSPASKRSASPDRGEQVSLFGEYNLYYQFVLIFKTSCRTSVALFVQNSFMKVVMHYR